MIPVQPSIKKKRPPGRPKKKKTREPNEQTSKRVDISKQCKTFGKLGHNRKSYKGEIGGNSSPPGTINRTSTSNKVDLRRRKQGNLTSKQVEELTSLSNARPLVS